MRDPSDFSSRAMTGTPTLIDQLLGIGDGKTTSFPLIKRYGGSDAQQVRRITRPVGDTAPVTSPIALRGIGLRPPAPVHARLSHTPDGGAVLTWARRARGAWLWLDGVETPLNEQAELYEVSFGPVSAPIARWETTQPRLTIAPTQRAQLASAIPAGLFTIRQRGDRDVSEPLTIALA